MVKANNKKNCFPLDNIKILYNASLVYGSLFRFWIGTKLYVVTSEPADLEIILHHPNCIDKDDSYRFLEESFAAVGLFTIQGEFSQLN